MAEKTTTLRLRRVRFKSGGTIEVLRQKKDDIVDILKNSVQRATEAAPEMAGFALVVWHPNGETYVNYEHGQRSTIQAGDAARFVHDCILAENVLRWSRE